MSYVFAASIAAGWLQRAILAMVLARAPRRTRILYQRECCLYNAMKNMKHKCSKGAKVFRPASDVSFDRKMDDRSRDSPYWFSKGRLARSPRQRARFRRLERKLGLEEENLCALGIIIIVGLCSFAVFVLWLFLPPPPPPEL